MPTRHELTNNQWNKIKKYLPPQRMGKKGRPRTRPKYLVEDKGYVCRNFRNGLRKKSIRHQVPSVKPGVS